METLAHLETMANLNDPRGVADLVPLPGLSLPLADRLALVLNGCRARARVNVPLDTVTKVPHTSFVDVEDRLKKLTSFRLRNLKLARYLEAVSRETTEGFSSLQPARSGHALPMVESKIFGTQNTLRMSLARKLRECGKSVIFSPDGRRVDGESVYSCNQYRICGNCASRRAGRYSALYADKCTELLKRHADAHVITAVFTIPSGCCIYDRTECLQKGLQILNKRASRKHNKTEWHKVIAGAASVEIKRGEGEPIKGAGVHHWHPHFHMLCVCSSPLDFVALRSEWERYTGGTNLWFKDLGRMEDEKSRGAVSEVLKYNVKLTDMNFEDNWCVYNQFARKRLLKSFGEFRGLELPEEETAPVADAFHSERRYFWDADAECFAPWSGNAYR